MSRFSESNAAITERLRCQEVHWKKVKEKYQQRIQDDFHKYAKQIGIMDEEMPQLVTDRNTMDEIRSKWPDGGRGSSTRRN